MSYFANSGPITLGSLVFRNGQTLELVEYTVGWDSDPTLNPGSDIRRYKGSPLESLSPGFHDQWYYAAIFKSYLNTLNMLKRNIITPEDEEYFRHPPYGVNLEYWESRVEVEEFKWAFSVFEGKGFMEMEKFVKAIFTPSK